MSSFKSCPREGASVSSLLVVFLCCVSSHAPVRGHRRIRGVGVLGHDVSSHAPVRGHPPNAEASKRRWQVSSHAPVRGHRAGYNVPGGIFEFQVMPP